MSIDTVTPRSRRAILLGALGGVAASVAAFTRPPGVAAADPNDVVLDTDNAGAGTTAILTASSNPAFRVTTTTGTGVKGEATTGSGVRGDATSGNAVHGVATSGAGVVAVSDTGYGLTADSSTNVALKATSAANHGIRGRGQQDGVIGESPGGRSGVVGFSGGGSAPVGPAKTGVYGEATQDSSSRGVHGFTLVGQGVRGEASGGQGVAGEASSGQGVLGVATSGQGVRGESLTGAGVFGQALGDAAGRGVIGKTDLGVGVRGEATSGVGVQAASATGVALAVSGRATLNRSGRVNIPANVAQIDVTVPGGVSANALGFAMLQLKRTGVWVIAVRPAYPSATQMRILLNKVASTTTTTPLAWFVFG